MTRKRASVTGILRAGYGVASGLSRSYPYGSLEMQIPIFKTGGLDLEGCYLGTLNLDIRPCTFKLRDPEFIFRDVRWTDLHPAEHFSFTRCTLAYKAAVVPAWIYYPHPETKSRHFHDPSLMEVMAPRIPEIRLGDAVEILVDPVRVAISCPEGGLTG